MTVYPQSVSGVDRFTPAALVGKANAPVYLIGIATRSARAVFRREVAAAGARFWAPSEFHRLAREYVEQVAPANSEELLARIDAIAAVSEETGVAEIQAAAADWNDLAEKLIRHFPVFAGRHADNQHYLTIAPMLAARMFLTGWEGGDLPAFRRGLDGLLLEEVAEQIPDADFDAIGWRAMALMQPQETERKNSVSPQPSRRIRRAMRAASSRKTTAPAGKSLEKSSPETHG